MAMKWVPAVTVKLPYPVSANRYWGERIVYPKVGKPFINHYVTPEAKQFKESVGWLLRNAGVRQVITGRVRVDLQLHPHCPKDWRTRAKKDPLWWADTVAAWTSTTAARS
jgi:crossover junction endodeoxyribonuclease RusA